MAFGNYDGSTAFALGGAVRLSNTAQAFATVGSAFGSDKIGSSVGVQFNW
jgi:hypothetical protein